MNKLKKIVCCVPLSWEFVSAEFLFSCLDMKEYSINKYNLLFITIRSCYMDKNRDELILLARKLNADYVLFLDADGVYPKDTPEILMGHIYSGKMVVGGIAPRKDNNLPSVYIFDENKLCNYPIKTHTGLIQVDALGLHGVMIDPKVFDRIKYPYFKMKWGEKAYEWGEDITFYRKCKQEYITVWCDTNLIFGHLSTKEIPLLNTEDILNIEMYKLEE